MDDSCCSKKEEACLNTVRYTHFFTRSKTLDIVCRFLASDDGNFTVNHTDLKYNNPLEDKMCPNATYFCPLVLRCISLNLTCNPDRVYSVKANDMFEQVCAMNDTFCPLYMRCIPSAYRCSYRALFDWQNAKNNSVGPFSQSCSTNQTFCPLTFSCSDSCDPRDIMGNTSCNGSRGDMCPESHKCTMNDTECKEKLTPVNFTNITDTIGSGAWR